MMGIEIIIQVIIIILAQVITKILLNCQALVKEGQNQSPLAGLALISGLFLFLKNRKKKQRK